VGAEEFVEFDPWKVGRSIPLCEVGYGDDVTAVSLAKDGAREAVDMLPFIKLGNTDDELVMFTLFGANGKGISLIVGEGNGVIVGLLNPDGIGVTGSSDILDGLGLILGFFGYGLNEGFVLIEGL
jgi:hypothetical protein